jgi:predicted ATPase
MPLRVSGEREYAVGPIGLPTLVASSADIETSDAVELFLDRGRAVRSDLGFREGDLSVVAEIVMLLEGIPLAIELAASRVRILDLATMRSQLDEQLPMLAGSQRDRPERQRTMRGAIDWSHRLLEEGDRRLFARIAVFPGGCTIDAVRSVCDDAAIDRPVIDGLESLVEKSLLRLEEALDAGPRFAMLIAIREYAEERLEQAGDADEVRRRAAAYLMALAEEAEPHLVADDQRLWLDRVERERPNFAAALSWAIETGEAELAQRTASALWRFWQQRAPVSEGLAILDEVVALEGTEPAVLARAHAAAGALAWWSNGDDVAARAHFERGYELAQRSGDERSLMVASTDLGFVTLWPLSRLRRDVAEARPPTPPTGPPSLLETDPANLEAAETLLQLSLGIAERLGDELGIAQAKRALGQLAGVARRDMPAAIPLVEEALERFERVGDRWEATETHITLANALRFSPHVDRARDHYLTGIDNLMLARNPLAATVLLLFAGFESQVGRHEQAVRLFAAGEAERAANGAVMPPGGALLMGDPVGRAVEAIGRPAVDQALTEGAAMTLEDAVAYARSR